MAGLQLDSLTTMPLDLPPLPRCEPRHEESFEDHLRRTPEHPPAQPQQPVRANDSPSGQRDSASTASRQPAQDAPHENTSHPHEVDRTTEAEKSKAGEKAKDDDSSLSADPANPVQGQSPPPAVPAAAVSVAQQAATELAAIDDKDLVAKALEAAGNSRRGKAAVDKRGQVQGKESTGSKDAGAGPEGVTESGLVETSVDPLAEHVGVTSKVQGDTESGKSTQTLAKPGRLAPGNEEGKSESSETGIQEQTASAGEQSTSAATDKTDGRKDRGSERHPKGYEEPVVQLDSGVAPDSTESAVSVTSAAPTVAASAGGSQNQESAAGESAASPAQSDAIAGPTGRLPQHLLSRTTEHASSGKQLTEADQTRFVQRVARAFQTAANEEGELRLRLSPPELGSLRLEVKVQGGVMMARIEAESSAARSLLLDNLPALRERLADQNIRLEQFDVDLADRHAGGQPHGAPQDHSRQSNGPGDAAVRFPTGEEPIDEPLAAPPTPHGAATGKLNVLV